MSEKCGLCGKLIGVNVCLKNANKKYERVMYVCDSCFKRVQARGKSSGE